MMQKGQDLHNKSARWISLANNRTSFTLYNYATGRGAEGVVKIEQINVDNNPATRYNFGASLDKVDSVQVSLNVNGKDFTIFFDSKDNKPFLQDELDTLNQILSNFRFD